MGAEHAFVVIFIIALLKAMSSPQIFAPASAALINKVDVAYMQILKKVHCTHGEFPINIYCSFYQEDDICGDPDNAT